MAMRGLGGAIGAGVAFSLLTACGLGESEAPAAPPKQASLAPTAEPAKRAAPAAPAKPVVEPRVERGPVVPLAAEFSQPDARRSLLRRLPRTALAVVCLDEVESLDAAVEKSALKELMAGPQYELARQQIDAGLAQMVASMRNDLPRFDEFLARARQLRGEFAAALIALDPMALAPTQTTPRFPVRFGLLFEATSPADEFDALLLDLCADAGARQDQQRFEVVSDRKTAWHRRMRKEPVQFDLVRDGSTFALLVGPEEEGDDPLPARAVEDSFAAADVVRSLPPLREGTRPAAELYLNLAPVWALVGLLAPPEAKEFLARSGFSSIRGVAGRCAVAQNGLDEHFVFCAPEGNDLLTRTVTASQLDAEMARWLPAESRAAALQTFDVATLFKAVGELLPDDARKEMDAGFAAVKRDTAIDLRQDVIENLGPTFALAIARPKVAAAGATLQQAVAEAIPEFVLAIEVKDGVRLRHAAEAALRAAGPRLRVKTRGVAGQLVTRSEPLPIPLGDTGEVTHLVPQWWIGDHVLLFATSDAAMERALNSGKDETARGPAGLAAALANPADHLVALQWQQDGADAVEPAGDGSVTRVQRTALGLELHGEEGGGMATLMGAAIVSGVVPAIAIPKLLQARNEANEHAAMANLRAIASAQAVYRSEARVDSDGDKTGEYGTLAELTGAAPPRGGGSPGLQLLGDALRPDSSGCALKNGYRYRIDLPKTTKRGSTVAVIAAERAEVCFTAYAWPEQPGSSGVRVFAIDQEGEIWASDNTAETQGYQALIRLPRENAHELRDAADRVSGVTAVRRGRDGGVWLEIE